MGRRDPLAAVALEVNPESPTGILLTNVGSPAAPTTAAVRRYLREFLSDPLVVDAPRLRWLVILNLVILPLRAPRSARLYRSIWTDEGSPLLATTRRQATALQLELERRRGRSTPVVAAMRYGAPSIAQGLAELEDAGCRSILILPLFPQFSRTTAGTTVNAVAASLRDRPTPLQPRFIEGYAVHPGYIEALASSIDEARPRRRRRAQLVMSFHGLPRRYADAGDPYPEQCRATAEATGARLGLEASQWRLTFQSRFGREEWLQPSTDRTLAELGAGGAEAVDVVCPGFAADCLETLEEVAVTNRRLYEDAGGRGFRYIAALNDRPDHVAALADLVLEHLGGREQHGSNPGC